MAVDFGRGANAILNVNLNILIRATLRFFFDMYMDDTNVHKFVLRQSSVYLTISSLEIFCLQIGFTFIGFY